MMGLWYRCPLFYMHEKYFDLRMFIRYFGVDDQCLSEEAFLLLF